MLQQLVNRAIKQTGWIFDDMTKRDKEVEEHRDIKKARHSVARPEKLAAGITLGRRRYI